MSLRMSCVRPCACLARDLARASSITEFRFVGRHSRCHGCTFLDKSHNLHAFPKRPNNFAFAWGSILHILKVSLQLHSRESSAVVALSCADLAQGLRDILLDDVSRMSCANVFKLVVCLVFSVCGASGPLQGPRGMFSCLFCNLSHPNRLYAELL
jgi:hypothetical protein